MSVHFDSVFHGTEIAILLSAVECGEDPTRTLNWFSLTSALEDLLILARDQGDILVREEKLWEQLPVPSKELKSFREDQRVDGLIRSLFEIMMQYKGYEDYTVRDYPLRCVDCSDEKFDVFQNLDSQEAFLQAIELRSRDFKSNLDSHFNRTISESARLRMFELLADRDRVRDLYVKTCVMWEEKRIYVENLRAQQVLYKKLQNVLEAAISEWVEDPG